MWISEMIVQKRQRQAAGPVRYGHLQIFEGGKIAEGVYSQPISYWRRLGNWLAPRQRSVQLCEKPPR